MKCRACGSETNREDWYEIKTTQHGGGLCTFYAVRNPETQIKVAIMACPICNTLKIG